MQLGSVLAAKSRRALVTPILDVLAGGGLSLVALPLLMLFGPTPLSTSDYSTLITLGILFNWPHFVASYFLLYSTKETVAEHRSVSLWIPAFLLLYALFCITVAGSWPVFFNLLIVFAGVYLARHYTGQAFGVMSSFAFVEGFALHPKERQHIRLALNGLMVWHIIWALDQSIERIAPVAKPIVASIYATSWVLLAAASLWGMWALGRYVHRASKAGHPFPLRVVVPFLAVSLWYLALMRDPSALLAVQVAHALQYLAFPIRAQLNRSAAENRRAAHWMLQLAIWVVVGLAVFEGIEPIFGATFRLAGGSGELPGLMAPILINCIGVHHYFIDGALYKLRNPRVRSLLFAHLAK